MTIADRNRLAELEATAAAHAQAMAAHAREIAQLRALIEQMMARKPRTPKNA